MAVIERREVEAAAAAGITRLAAIKERRDDLFFMLSPLINEGIPGSKWVINLGASPQTPGIYRFGTNPEAGIMKRGAKLTPRLSLGP